MTTHNHTDTAADNTAAIAAHVTVPDGQLDAAIGDRATLTTSVKTSLVAALNEVKAAAGTVLADNVVTQAKIADAAVGPAELHASVAGNGLSGAAGAALAVNVDAATIEIASDVVRVKDGGVTGPKIATTALSIPNLARDAFNRALAAGDNDHRERWFSPTVLTRISPDANNPYGLPTTRQLYVVSGSTNGGRYFYLDEMGAAVGDTLSFAADVSAASGTYDLRAQFYTSALAAVAGSLYTGTTTPVSARTRLTTPLATVPATAAIVALYVHRVSGTVDIDHYAMWAAKGSFLPTGLTPSHLDTLAVAQQTTPLQLDDPFNADLLTTASLASSWGGRLRWQNGFVLSAVSPDPANPYSLPTLRMGTTASSAGKRFWFDELGAKIGDVLHFGIECMAASDNFRLNARPFDAEGAFTGTQVSGVTRTFAGAVQKLTVGNCVVPAGAVGIAVYPSRASGSVPLDIYSMWGAKGMSLQLTPAPTLSTHIKAEIVAARGTYADLDARLDAIVTSVFPSSQDRYGRFLLKDWQGQIAKVQQALAGEQAVCAFIGDSWVNNNYLAGPLTTWLQSTYGNAGPGWCSFMTDNTNPNGITTGSNAGTWTEVDQPATTARGVDFAHVLSSDIATPAKRTRSGTFTDVVIHYLKQSGGGEFRWKIDAGAWTTVATANATNLFATETIAGLTNAAHTLYIEVLTAGASGVILMGADFQIKPANGVRVHKVGNGGLTAGQASTVDATIWQAGITALAPNLAIILLATNDDSADVVPATFGTQIATLVARVRAAAPKCDVLLMSPTANGLASGTYATGLYIEQLRAKAVELNCAMVDFYLHLPAWTDLTTRALNGTGPHLSPAGGQFGANLLTSMLRVT